MRYLHLLGLGVGWLLAAALSPCAADSAQDEQVLREAHIATDGPELLAFFKQRTLGGLADENRLGALIKQLGDDDFAKREDATQQLVALGQRARPALLRALKDSDIEVVRRAQDCLKRIEHGAAAAVIAAGVRVLARRQPAGSAEVLLSYLPAAEDDMVAAEVRMALADLAVRGGKTDPVLVAALSDPSALKRAAAAAALCRAKDPGQMPAVRKLLGDPDPVVRMRVAFALALNREKEVVPVLIGLLGRLEARERGLVESFLARLAEDKGPELVPGSDEASLKKHAEAWLAWWKEAGPALDPARLEAASRTRNNTLVVLLDLGRIVDLDDRNQPRWQINNLDLPLDAQFLPGDRVLVAEHDGNRVTERNRKGEILWKKEISGPLVAQRLPNGNTFIATKAQLLEYDKDGKEVFSYQRPGGEQFMKAQKLRNGDIGCITQVGVGVTRYVRLDPAGKELKSFAVELHSFGGRVEVLANGHVIVPEMHNNRVLEHDADGKVVWEMATEQPIAAVRLPNGNTLVTSMSKDRGAVELDPAGKEVWSYRAGTRVTRALRR
jgi:HEAT repeat protein